MDEKRCKAFNECIQPHICGPSTDCIWGHTEETTKDKIMMIIDEIETRMWNAAIEAAAKAVDKDTRYDQAGYEFGPALEIRKLKK